MLVIGGLLASSGIGFAAATIVPWHHTAPSYFCRGYQGAAFCRLRGTQYEGFVTRRQISIVFQGQVIFSCHGYPDPVSDCNDYR